MSRSPHALRPPPVPARSHRRSKTPDLAFADTVVVDDLPDAMPLSSDLRFNAPSGCRPPTADLRFNDESGIERHVASVAFPPPAPLVEPAPDIPPPPRSRSRPRDEPSHGLRGAWKRMRTGVRAQREEFTWLWSAAAALDADPRDPTRPSRTPLARRLRTLLSFFEWDRADVLRAAWIGLAVFFLAATLGAIILRVGMR